MALRRRQQRAQQLGRRLHPQLGCRVREQGEGLRGVLGRARGRQPAGQGCKERLIGVAKLGKGPRHLGDRPQARAAAQRCALPVRRALPPMLLLGLLLLLLLQCRDDVCAGGLQQGLPWGVLQGGKGPQQHGQTLQGERLPPALARLQAAQGVVCHGGHERGAVLQGGRGGGGWESSG